MPNKYSQTPQAVLDLHQYTCDEARVAVFDFLDQSKIDGYSIVQIIVGKGLHSENGQVLGDFVRNLLDENGYNFRNAKINQGAEGAIDVQL